MNATEILNPVAGFDIDYVICNPGPRYAHVLNYLLQESSVLTSLQQLHCHRNQTDRWHPDQLSRCTSVHYCRPKYQLLELNLLNLVIHINRQLIHHFLSLTSIDIVQYY